MTLRPLGALLLAAALAAAQVVKQDIDQLEQLLTEEDQKLSEALKSATYWKTIGQSKKDELTEVLKAQKFAQNAKLGGFGNSDATAASRLAACLRTRDAAELETERLQGETATLAAQVEAAQRDRNLANETSLRRIAECESKANETMTESAAQAAQLQKSLTTLQSESTNLQKSLQTVESENKALNAKLSAMAKEHMRQLEEIKNQGTRELAAMKNQDAKVMQAHKVLQKAHEVLQKRHKELQDAAKQENEKNAAEQQRVQKEFQTCTQELAAAKETEAELLKKQEAVKIAAMKKGAEQSVSQFQGALKNATATKATLEAKIKEAEALVAKKEAIAKEASKDVPDMELKLRRCIQSREKTELDYQKILKRCPEKGAFLQQWP